MTSAQYRTDGLAERLARLPAERRAMVEQALLAARRPAEPGIARRASGGPAQLSYAQQRLWFLDRWQAGGALHGLHAATRLTGAFDIRALRHALDAVVARHEVLRT
ncbi:MAG TPA: condensation domain-containing protein, partial [Streptosporangiaceae bacterium]|nr:condensation domain-containing protein [Streptosporangiaceae bacterium]